MYTINIFRVEKEKDKVFKVFYVMMNSLELLLYFQVCSCFKEILFFLFKLAAKQPYKLTILFELWPVVCCILDLWQSS